MAAHQAPPSLGFSRQEHWSGLPFLSPMHESEKWQWSRSVVSDSSSPMNCSPPGSSAHGIFQAGVLEWGATAFSRIQRQCLPFQLLGRSSWAHSPREAGSSRGGSTCDSSLLATVALMVTTNWTAVAEGPMTPFLQVWRHPQLWPLAQSSGACKDNNSRHSKGNLAPAPAHLRQGLWLERSWTQQKHHHPSVPGGNAGNATAATPTMSMATPMTEAQSAKAQRNQRQLRLRKTKSLCHSTTHWQTKERTLISKLLNP